MLLSVLSWNYTADGDLAAASVVGVLQTVLMVTVIVLARVLFDVIFAPYETYLDDLLGVKTSKNAM